jgi:6-phosphofructokinase 2
LTTEDWNAGTGTAATVTANPAIDVSTRVASIVAERKLRCGPPVFQPGGGGINVARAIRRLGGEVQAVFPSGGPAGRLLEELMAEEGVTSRVIPIAGRVRENLNVLESETGRQFRFVLPGPELSESECARLFDAVARLEPFPDYLVASGSLPPGAPEDLYARLARLTRERGGRLVLDASGPALARALDEGVYLCKPSLREFGEWTGEPAGDEAAWRRRARRVVEEGSCEVLVVSLGAAGVLWTTRDEQERLTSPAVPVASSVGAGDSLVAGIVFSLCRGRSVRDAMRLGVAAAAATVMTSGTSLFRREDADRLLAAVAGADAEPAPERGVGAIR